jgi:hypothetical protein
MKVSQDDIDNAIKTVKHEIFMREVVFKKNPEKQERKIKEMEIVLNFLKIFKRMIGDVTVDMDPGDI